MHYDTLPEHEREALEAATFRRLVTHLRDRPEVQNIDLMRLADFCRNCLGKWLAAAAAERGVALDKEQAREAVYGMAYADWKAQHQRPEGPPLRPTPVMMCIAYRDALAAIDWLCDAFGFVRHAVYADGATVHHAQLTFGNAMFMLSSARDGEPDCTMPSAAGAGACTAVAYVVVADVDAHHDRAVAAGASVVRPLTDEPYGGRDYVCRDPFGQVWSFGSYDPWASAGGG